MDRYRKTVIGANSYMIKKVKREFFKMVTSVHPKTQLSVATLLDIERELIFMHAFYLNQSDESLQECVVLRIILESFFQDPADVPFIDTNPNALENLKDILGEDDFEELYEDYLVPYRANIGKYKQWYNHLYSPGGADIFGSGTFYKENALILEKLLGEVGYLPWYSIVEFLIESTFSMDKLKLELLVSQTLNFKSQSDDV